MRRLSLASRSGCTTTTTALVFGLDRSSCATTTTTFLVLTRSSAAQPRVSEGAWPLPKPDFSELVVVNETLPQFRKVYEDVLKRTNIAENSEKGQNLKEIVKLKFMSLEQARNLQGPEAAAKAEKDIAEMEKLLLNYRPSVQATVDVAFDTKNHTFITDSVAAELFQKASYLIDKEEWVRKMVDERLGLTPRKKAETIYDLASQFTRTSRLGNAAETLPKRGDLPAWATRLVIDQRWDKVNSKAQLLDKLFPTTPPQVESKAARALREQGPEAARAAHIEEAAALEGLEPGTPEYNAFAAEWKDWEPKPDPLTEEYQKNTNKWFAERESLRKHYRESLLDRDIEADVIKEAEQNAELYGGENGVARRAVRGFLLGNPSPSSDDKLKFMKTLRQSLRSARKANGVVLRELYPHLNLPTHEVNVDDETLLKKFDYYAATL